MQQRRIIATEDPVACCVCYGLSVTRLCFAKTAKRIEIRDPVQGEGLWDSTSDGGLDLPTARRFDAAFSGLLWPRVFRLSTVVRVTSATDCLSLKCVKWDTH